MSQADAGRGQVSQTGIGIEQVSLAGTDREGVRVRSTGQMQQAGAGWYRH